MQGIKAHFPVYTHFYIETEDNPLEPYNVTAGN